MRLIVLKYTYPTYLRRWYAGRPHEGERSYAEQRAALEDDSFWWSGSSQTNAQPSSAHGPASTD